jgi:hypothetical protein
METNFFAPMALTRLVLPAMRKRHSGTIVNISSAAGIQAKASRSLYSSSKFALEAFSEALYHEMKQLGVQVLIVVPGAFRSPFAGNLTVPKTGMPGEYKGTVTDQTLQAVKDMATLAPPPGDVEKGVQAIFDVVMKTGQAEKMEEFLRLLLGKDGNANWSNKIADLRRNLDGMEKIWRNTDHDDYRIFFTSIKRRKILHNIQVSELGIWMSKSALTSCDLRLIVGSKSSC